MSVKYGLLSILNRRSMHGYELRRELADELGAEWAVNYGQIYSTLERLTRKGLVVHSETVSSAEAPDRKLYTVTPAGRTELRNWLLSPTDGVESARDELYAKVVLALTSDVDVQDVIQVERKGQMRRIGMLTEAKERLDPEVELTAVLQLDMAIMKTESLLRWLDAAEAKVRKAAAGGADGVTRSGAASRAVIGEAAERQEATREGKAR